MVDVCTHTIQLKKRQTKMFAAAEKLGHTVKNIATDLGLKSPTIVYQYARGETAMSGPAIMKAKVAFGKDYGALISMLFDDNLQLVDAPEEMDHEEVDQACRDYSDTKAEFHREDSECGPAIGPTEDKVLRGKGTKLQVAS